MKKIIKAIGYIRVSTADQANSLEVQTQKIKDYCKFRGIYLTQIYTDEDVSGGKPFSQREGGSAANAALINGEADAIICVKPDRLFRNVKDALITVDDWSELNIALHIIDMGGNSIDTQTALGRTFFIQAISMAEFERRIAGERTKSVLNHKKEAGKAYCGAILGFTNFEGKFVVDVEEMKIVKLIFLLKQLNLSLNEIADKLNRENYKAKKGGKYYASTIKAILENSIYKEHI